ncbi:tetratricopeptide repeat protein [Candidatus Electronema sp. PJ]|uniref:tetratricopeptide repeat protein n=1 Tax=Candidatus Electronema sp. PJ TaxID=3401572 RepID=UPI003AA80CC8
MDISGFAKVAPYLTHPLVLVGFVLMLVFGIHSQLMKSGLLRQVNQKDSSLIIRLFLRYGFWLALTLLLAGVSLSAWNSYMEKEKVQIQAVDADKLAEKLLAPLQGQLSAKDEQIKVLTEAITALSKTGAPAASINDALQALQQGDTAKAQAIFAEVLRSKEAEGRQANKEAAAAARHLGALASITKPKEALLAYQKAVELDPDNADGWKQLGDLLLYRTETRELAQAEEAFRKVLSLGEAQQNKKWQAAALNNLGRLAQMRGELDKAEEMLKKGLEMSEALGFKEGMAASYSTLGFVAYHRDELDKAEEMYRKSLALCEALGFKECIETEYLRLCLVYNARGELDKAEEMCRKSIDIVESLGYKDWTAENYATLGDVYEKHGKLDKAEEMYRKSLEISEALGHKEGMASDYGNLGLVYQTRGELDKAEELWKKSLSLYQEMGAMQHEGAKIVQQLLDKLAQERASQPAPPAASPR